MRMKFTRKYIGLSPLQPFFISQASMGFPQRFLFERRWRNKRMEVSKREWQRDREREKDGTKRDETIYVFNLLSSQYRHRFISCHSNNTLCAMWCDAAQVCGWYTRCAATWKCFLSICVVCGGVRGHLLTRFYGKKHISELSRKRLEIRKFKQSLHMSEKGVYRWVIYTRLGICDWVRMLLLALSLLSSLLRKPFQFIWTHFLPNT